VWNGIRPGAADQGDQGRSRAGWLTFLPADPTVASGGPEGGHRADRRRHRRDLHGRAPGCTTSTWTPRRRPSWRCAAAVSGEALRQARGPIDGLFDRGERER